MATLRNMSRNFHLNEPEKEPILSIINPSEMMNRKTSRGGDEGGENTLVCLIRIKHKIHQVNIHCDLIQQPSSFQ